MLTDKDKVRDPDGRCDWRGGGAARTSSRDNGKASLNLAVAGSGVLENWNIEAPRCAGVHVGEEVGVAPASALRASPAMARLH